VDIVTDYKHPCFSYIDFDFMVDQFQRKKQYELLFWLELSFKTVSVRNALPTIIMFMIVQVGDMCSFLIILLFLDIIGCHIN